jgi:hypothetical protein
MALECKSTHASRTDHLTPNNPARSAGLSIRSRGQHLDINEWEPLVRPATEAVVETTRHEINL